MDDITDNYCMGSLKLSEYPCTICQLNWSKYRCPRCSITSCSLPCVNLHKTRDSCSGKRDRSGFISRSSMDITTLQSDIAFLEDISTISGRARKMMKSADPMSHKEVLVQEANKRRVDLRLLAEWFPKRKENLSYYAGNRMYWTVKWIVYWESGDADTSVPIEILKHRCLEHAKLLDLLKSLPSAAKSEEEKTQLFALIVPPQCDHLDISLKLDPAYTRPQYLFRSLHVKKGLKECLRGTLIVEYPTIVVKVKTVPSSARDVLNLSVQEVADAHSLVGQLEIESSSSAPS